MPNSYGTPAGVAALAPRYGSGTGDAIDFTTTTRPTKLQVTTFIDQISGLLNSMLAEAGFTIPVTQADAVLALTYFVQEEVASIAEGINGSGRFGPTAKAPRKGRFAVIWDDVKMFVEMNKTGLERMGAARPYGVTAGVLYRANDEAGDPTFPIRQRKEFGNLFENWDQ